MFWRAVIAFLAMPGVVAFAVPLAWLWFAGKLSAPHPLGLLVLAAGVVGLYRCSRNPMYVCVLLTLLGWSATFGSAGLVVYAGVIAVAFHLRVVLGEEPWLSRAHGIAWQEYKGRVPRWFGPRAK